MDLAWIFGRRKKGVARLGVRDDPPAAARAPDSHTESFQRQALERESFQRQPLESENFQRQALERSAPAPLEPRSWQPDPPRSPMAPPVRPPPPKPPAGVALARSGDETVMRRSSPAGELVGVLIVLEGSAQDRHKLFALRSGDNAIGRDSENKIVLETESVSREHAVIRAASGGSFSLEAKPSRRSPGVRNTTFLNDRLVERELLSDGDTIKLGDDVLLRFRTV